MLPNVLQSESLLYNGTLISQKLLLTLSCLEFGAGLIPTWTPVLVYERSSCRIFTTKCRTLSKLRKGFELCAISRLPARVVAALLDTVEDTTGPILAVIAVATNQDSCIWFYADVASALQWYICSHSTAGSQPVTRSTGNPFNW